jgi:hypothetical protein
MLRPYIGPDIRVIPRQSTDMVLKADLFFKSGCLLETESFTCFLKDYGKGLPIELLLVSFAFRITIHNSS